MQSTYELIIGYRIGVTKMKTVDITSESFLIALKWWNSLTPKEQALREQAFIQALSPNIASFEWASEEWKIHQLYWVGRK